MKPKANILFTMFSKEYVAIWRTHRNLAGVLYAALHHDNR